MGELINTMKIASSGMRVQGKRLRVIAENLANASSLAQEPGKLPYRRKVITFKTQLDRKLGIDLVTINKIGYGRGEFSKKFDPSHPAADADGYVLLPNVNPLIEMMDMREAQRSYEANVAAIKSSKAMLKSTLDILR